MWFGGDGELHYAPAHPGQDQPLSSPPLPQWPPFPEPRRRRRWPMFLAIGLVAVVLLCAAPVAFVASRLPMFAENLANAADPTTTVPPSPGPNSPAKVRHAWITHQISTALNQQTTALLKGDQKAYLSTVDPKASKLVAGLKRRFASLRALRVTQYDQRVASFPSELEGTSASPNWEVRLDIHFCFAVQGCVTDRISVDSIWAETANGLRMTSLEQTDAHQNGPRPWEVSALKAAVGKRVIVATTSRYAARLPRLLKEAEKAALVADKFVISGRRPDRYHVFVATPSDWKRWFGGELPGWSVGFATAVSHDRMEVVLNIDEIQSDYLDEVLRHELGHVATLSSDDSADDSNFWLIEGMAEYIQESGQPVNRYDGRAAVRRYLDERDWDGDVAVSSPLSNAEDWEVAAQYGIGYYAVRRMAERFGQAKMISFFSAVVLQDGNALDSASRKIFGKSWANVKTDCAKYVRRQA